MVRNVLATGMLTILAFGAGVAFAQVGTQTGREPQFENAEVKVWKSTIVPHTPLPLHRHDHPRVLVALQGGTMNIVDEDGSTETHEWKTGNAYWLASNPPGTRHQDVNVGEKPIEVMVIELEKAN